MHPARAAERGRRSDPPPAALSWRRWVRLCAAAEGIGMTAAAAAARTAQALTNAHPTPAARAGGLAIIVVGGLVEGVALGTLQARGLRAVVPALPVRRWQVVTTAVAGLGWAAGSAPAALSSADDSGAGPPVLLMLAGAGGLGVVMGVVLGAAQAVQLRGLVRHPGRWVVANAVAWVPAMAVIFGGAGLASADTPDAAVIALGTATGLAAGAVLGAVTWPFLRALDRPSHRSGADPQPGSQY